MLLDFKVPGKPKEIGLAVVCDVHFGADTCHEKGFKAWVARIKKEGWYWLGLGDLTENSLKTSVGDVYTQKYSPQKQLQGVCEILEPIAGHCLGMVAGNHGARTVRAAGIDIDNAIAANLGIKYYTFTVAGRIQIGDTNWRVMGHHTSGGGRTAGGKMNALVRMSEVWPAMNLYLGAHTHASLSYTDTIRRVSIHRSKAFETELIRNYSGCGSALRYAHSYAEAKMYAPASLCQVVHFLGARVNHRADKTKADRWLLPYRRQEMRL